MFVNLGVLLSRGNSNIFQGPNLPAGKNLTIWYGDQDELGFHPAVEGVAPLSWKEVLPLFLSFFDYCSLSISSGPTSRVVDNVLRCMRSLPSLFESSVKARGTDVATVVVPVRAKCTSYYIHRDYNVHTLCERKKTLDKKSEVHKCLLPPTATTIGPSTVASLPFVLVSVPATRSTQAV